MKKCVLILGVLVIMVFASFAVNIGTARASCSNIEVDCKIEGSIKVGTVYVGGCYDWANNECKVCHGNAYPAKQCNKKIVACAYFGNCLGCWMSGDTDPSHEVCYDINGNKHDPK
jgi:hypothetical protein